MAVQAQYPFPLIRDSQSSKTGEQTDPYQIMFSNQLRFSEIPNNRKRLREGKSHTSPATSINGFPLQFQSALFSQEDIANEFKQQSDELDRILQSQGNHLRRTLADDRRRRYRALLRSAGESLGKKEAELQTAARRASELEACAARLGAEAQAWEVKARAQEAEAASLQAQLERAIAGTLSISGEAPAEDAESSFIDPARLAVDDGPVCRACRERDACVVLLPCRHLSVCSPCNDVVSACPVCLNVRHSSVEVSLS